MYIAIAIVISLWIIIQCKTSRPDGTLLTKLHPYRYLMPFVMRTRNESVVYFDCPIRARSLLTFVTDTPVSLTHCLVYACAKTLHQYPEMNRFVSGRRLYQRNEVKLSFSMKRIKLDQQAKLSVVTLTIPKDDSLSDIARLIEDNIQMERSGKKTYADKEFALFSMIPAPLFDVAARLFIWADTHNLLPRSFIDNDGMFASAFIANLGSLQMSAGYHHLYEWGNCPLFIMAGQIEERAIIIDGQLVVEPILPLRFSFDERVNDGLTAKQSINFIQKLLENPNQYCLDSMP